MRAMAFHPGNNLALKVPAHLYDQTVAFYRDVLRLAPWPEPSETPTFSFGTNRLWIDRVPALSQPELWLEILTDDLEEAARHFQEHGVDRIDEVEPLPERFRGFWIAAPGGMVHLVCEPDGFVSG